MSERNPSQDRLSPFDAEGQLWRTLTPKEEAVPDLALALARNRSGPGDEYASRIPTSEVTVEYDAEAAVRVTVRGSRLPVTALAPSAEVEGEPIDDPTVLADDEDDDAADV